MKHNSLEAWPRPTSRTSGASQVRREGFIPAIVLGRHQPAVTLKIKNGDLIRVLKASGPNALIDLSLEGQNTLVMIREFTRHPVSRRILHVDFQRVDASEPVEVAVSVVITGEPTGDYTGYLVTQEVSSLPVRALPGAVPQNVTVDATLLRPTHPLVAREIVLPEGVTLAGDPEQAVAGLAALRGGASTTDATETEEAAASDDASAA